MTALPSGVQAGSSARAIVSRLSFLPRPVTRKSTGTRLDELRRRTVRTNASVSPEGDHVGRAPPRLVTLRAPREVPVGIDDLEVACTPEGDLVA